ncbi:MAG: YihY/virulence factor BrkB family protein [Phototrophicaceae bacterium]
MSQYEWIITHEADICYAGGLLITKIWQLIRKTFQQWQKDNVSLIAAALSYYTVFALAPLLVIVIVVAGTFLGQSSVETQIINEFGDLLGAETADLITTMIQSLQNSGNGVIPTLISISLLLFGATNLFFQLETALNRIWHIEPKTSDGSLQEVLKFVQKRVLSFGFVLGLGILLIISLVMNSFLSAFVRLISAEIAWIGLPLQLVNILVSMTVLTLIFAMIYKYLPDTKINWQDVWVGAIVTSLLFIMGQLAIGAYLGRSTITSTYGAAGSLAALLVWVYYSMQILLIGAEFTQVYTHTFREYNEIGMTD